MLGWCALQVSRNRLVTVEELSAVLQHGRMLWLNVQRCLHVDASTAEHWRDTYPGLMVLHEDALSGGAMLQQQREQLQVEAMVDAFVVRMEV